MKLLDLFCGRWGWSKAFAKRGWECTGIDLAVPPEVPERCTYIQANILDIDASYVRQFDFICASSPCEQFSVHGMKHFHPNPPYPELGIKLFEYTRRICEESGVPYVIENVRAAQQFVGNAKSNSGPFFLWGTGVPPFLRRSSKGMSQARQRDANGKRIYAAAADRMWSTKRKQVVAEIPDGLATRVAEYAERLLETRAERA